MKYFLPPFFVLFFLNTNAQLSTNVYWTRQTALHSSEVIYFSPGTELVWSNFTGRPDQAARAAAITVSGFGYKAEIKNSGDNGTLNIGVYCYFSKTKSWVKEGRTNPFILNHEQQHFNISFIAANIFFDKLKNASVTESNYNEMVPRIYNECCAIMNKLQDDYDGQTNNGQNKGVQAKWNEFLTGKIGRITR